MSTESRRFLTLFHVTTKQNVNNIIAQGIDPSKSVGKRRVSWFVEFENVMWAIAHTSNRKQVVTGDLAVFVVVVDAALLKRTRWKGVWTRDTVTRVSYRDFAGIEKFLKDPEYTQHE